MTADRTGPPPTRRGIPFDQAASGLQKAIRRNDEELALRFAVELDVSGFGAYVWRRLFTMTSEDVGLAEPQLPAAIWSLYEMAEHLARKAHRGQRPGRMQMIHAVLLLARAKKSRIVDSALIWSSREQEPLDVPDWALDRHTRAGRERGRGHEHFWQEGTLLADRDTGELSHAPHLEDPYRDRAIALARAGHESEPAQNERRPSGQLSITEETQ